MDSQLIIRIDKETKKKFYETSRIEGKTASEKIRELVENYVTENDFEAMVDKLFDKVSAAAEKSGITEKDVAKAIKDVRAEKNRKNTDS